MTVCQKCQRPVGGVICPRHGCLTVEKKGSDFTLLRLRRSHQWTGGPEPVDTYRVHLPRASDSKPEETV